MAKQGRPKVDSVEIKFKIRREIHEMIKADAEKNGISMAAYLTMLASQKHLEQEAMRMVSAIPNEKLRQMLMEKDEADG